MGLLDDAIREHLELKRLRGVDPGDVAREEDAALGPVRRGDEPEPRAPGEDHDETTGSGASTPPAAQASPSGDSSAGQETVEINMEAELAESDPELARSGDVGPAMPVDQPDREQASSAEALEWEMPADRRADHHVVHGDRSDGGSGPESSLGQTGEESVEDVLEETPDFLRDTPEQERLWFEQRPPRDFDFNE